MAPDFFGSCFGHCLEYTGHAVTACISRVTGILFNIPSGYGSGHFCVHSICFIYYNISCYGLYLSYNISFSVAGGCQYLWAGIWKIVRITSSPCCWTQMFLHILTSQGPTHELYIPRLIIVQAMGLTSLEYPSCQCQELMARGLWVVSPAKLWFILSWEALPEGALCTLIVAIVLWGI